MVRLAGRRTTHGGLFGSRAVVRSITRIHIRAVRLLKEELQLLQEPGSYVGEVIKVRARGWRRDGTARPGWCHSRSAWLSSSNLAVAGYTAAKSMVIPSIHGAPSTARPSPPFATHTSTHAGQRSLIRCVRARTRPALAQLMGKNKVLVKVHPEGKYVVDIDKEISIDKLNPGARVALRNDSYTLHLVLPTKVDPLVSLMKVEKVPDSTYDMIGGADQQIKEIKEVRMQHAWTGERAQGAGHGATYSRVHDVVCARAVASKGT